MFSIVGVIAVSVSLVFIYEEEVVNLIITELNKHLKTEVRIDPKNINLTIIQSFPDCAIEFKDLTAMDSKEFESKDTLLYAKRLSLAFNIKDLFNKNYTVKKIELDQARCYLKVNNKGNANYLVWISEKEETSNDSLKFALEKIRLTNIDLIYKDSKHKIKLNTSIKELNFRGKFNENNYTLKSDGNAFVNLFQADKVKYLKDKNLNFDIEIEATGSTYNIRKSETFINATHIVSNGNFIVKDSLQSLDINFNGKNLDISTTLSLLPEQFKNKITDYESDGEFYASGECHYINGKPFILKSDFGIKHASISYKQTNTTLKNVNLSGSIELREKYSALKLLNISAELNSNTFAGDVEISNFEDPYLKMKFDANTNLEELLAFYPIDTLQEVSGSIKVTAEIEGLISEMRSNAYSPSIKAKGKAVVANLKAKFKQSDKQLNIPEGELQLNNRHLNVFGLKVIKGKSDVTLVGEMPNFLSYLFDATVPLTIVAKVTSDNIELEDFLFGAGQSSETSSIKISEKLDFNISVDVKHLSFSKFTADNIQGIMLLKNQKIALKGLTLNVTDGQLMVNAFADASGDIIRVSADCDLKKLNIQKLFTQLNNFGQTTIQDNNLKGYATASIDFTGNWDRKLNADLNSINLTSSVLIERGELIGFKPLESLAKFIDVNELRHIKFSTLQSAVEIKNRIITIPKTSIKSNALNLELWGKHDFENVIDYHIQLLISELLAKKPRSNKNFDEELSLIENDPENRRSVFILMTGPIDNPSIKYDRKGAKEKIKQDIQQEKQNLKQILREEFGFFKKDSVKTKEIPKSNQNFQIESGNEPRKNNKPLQPKKKEEDDDF
ncbi:MAG: AsmA-like C-terminal region-containing protein [Bacteroidota bacterium]